MRSKHAQRRSRRMMRKLAHKKGGGGRGMIFDALEWEMNIKRIGTVTFIICQIKLKKHIKHILPTRTSR